MLATVVNCEGQVVEGVELTEIIPGILWKGSVMVQDEDGSSHGPVRHLFNRREDGIFEYCGMPQQLAQLIQDDDWA
jgi:hypothetical protein